MEFRGESMEQDLEPERNKHHTLVAVQKIMFIPVMSTYIYATFDTQCDYSQWVETSGNIMFTENSAHS
jgi:hypothetical protein